MLARTKTEDHRGLTNKFVCSVDVDGGSMQEKKESKSLLAAPRWITGF